MKRIYGAVFGVSLLVNVGLLAAMLGPGRTNVTSAEEKGTSANVTTVAGDAASAAAAAAAVPSRSGEAVPGSRGHKPANWSDLYSSDMRRLAANLRAAGLSEKMVFTIVAGLVRQDSMRKMREIMTRSGIDPFWKSTRDGGFDMEKQKQVSAVMREERQFMEDLFGTQAVNDNDREVWEQRYGPLPIEKLQKITALNSDYSDLMMQSGGFGMGPQMPWERETRAKLDQQKRKDIEALLTPAELETFDLYSSSTASSIRRDLASFAPTEAEFRTLYELRKAFDEKYSYNAMPADTPEFGMQRMTAQKQLNEQIKSALGARYADYERSVDRGYQAAANISRRLNLPDENAAAVYALQQDIQRRAAMAQALPPDNRTAALRDLATEANTKLATLLTDQGAQAYKARGGTWLRTLERPPMRVRSAIGAGN